MKAKWIDEVAGILDSEPFKAWLERLNAARKDLKVSSERYEELLTQVNLLDFRAELLHRRAIDTLERANVLEDESTGLANEAAALENSSFEAVSQFELQRARTTELWQRLGAVDVDIEESSDPSQKKKLQRLRDKVNLDYEREDARKQKLWAEVEKLWLRNIDKALELREKRHKATIVRAEAEALFQKHAAENGQADELRQKAEAVALEKQEKERQLKASHEQARERFECILHQDFLYWSAREDNKLVYAAPVVNDKENYGVEVKAGRLYRCPHDKGIDSLERLKDVYSRHAPDGDKDGGKAADAVPDAEVASSEETEDA